MSERSWKDVYGRPCMEGKGSYLPLCYHAKIIDKEENLKVRRLKESASMLGYCALLSIPSIEMNTIWKSLFKMAR